MTEERPLHGTRILVTREASQAAELAGRLERAGALPVSCPLIALRPPEDWSQTDSAIAKIRTFDGVVFTSANGVRFFLSRVLVHPGALQELSRLPCYAVGPATAKALKEKNLSVCPLPERFQAEGLCELLGQGDLKGKRFLFPRAREGRDALPAFLRDRGADFELLVVYETRSAHENRDRLRALLAEGAFDYVTFTSPSTVRAYAAFASPTPPSLPWREIPAACIGEVTAEAARTMGLKTVFAASPSTLDGLVQALVLREKERRLGSGAKNGPRGTS
jgi:uroporphyrinogen III methyltransferase/synthase